MLNNLGERVWQEHIKTMMPDNVRIIGRVIGQVIIKDLNKVVQYNQMIDISIIDAKRSADLLNAISKKWIDIVSGKEHLQSQYTSEKQVVEEPVQRLQPQVQQVVQQSINKDEIRQVVNESMAVILDALKNLNSTSIDDKTIDSIANKIVGKIPTTVQKSNDIVVDDVAKNVFIDLDQNIQQRTNISDNIGQTQEEKVDISGSLEKMKRFKKINKGEKS